jgi:hypothetical protein
MEIMTNKSSPTKNELHHVQTKCKGETWEEAEERNEYFKNQGYQQATADFIKMIDKFKEETSSLLFSCSSCDCTKWTDKYKNIFELQVNDLLKQMLVEKK